MPLARRAGFVTAMDQPIARGRFSVPALGGAALLALAVAASGAWLALYPAQRTMSLEKWKVSIAWQKRGSASPPVSH
jgi:hypothetical protein